MSRDDNKEEEAFLSSTFWKLRYFTRLLEMPIIRIRAFSSVTGVEAGMTNRGGDAAFIREYL